MPFEQPATGAGWSATLALGFEARGGATVLARRRHAGPLVVQKPLYPEGPQVCHAILIHPPAGICGGDTLDVRVEADARSHAFLTTPGAGKWYRSVAGVARQRVAIAAHEGAVVEWMPQEAIVYSGAQARMTLDVALAADATFVGMEIVCLGRTASQERFDRGALAMSTRIARGDAPVWIERGAIAGGDPLLDSPVGLAGQPVFGTLLVASEALDAPLLARCREVFPREGRGGLTWLPGLLVARYLGPACEPARAWLAAIWSIARPQVARRPPSMPRIWNT